MLDLISLGECMIEFYCDGSISKAAHFHKAYGGDTLNTVVAAARLGSRTGFISKFGEDPFAPYLYEEIAAEGVDLACCPAVQGFNGLYLIALGEKGQREFTYYRTGSAAATLGPEELDAGYIRSARILHASGISQAISRSCRSAVRRAFQIAREAGVRTSYDPNFRPKLWSSNEAREALEEILPSTDIFLPSSPDETRQLLNTADAREIDGWARERGAQIVVIKEGEGGCVVVEDGMPRRVQSPSDIRVVDTSGAGDAFNGGFLHGLLRGLATLEAAELGAITAALKIQGRGAVRSLPGREAVAAAAQDKSWATRAVEFGSPAPSRSSKSLAAYVDGGSRGNPGAAGAGIHLELDGEPWRGLYEYVGIDTNNRAEYAALVRALEYALERGFRKIRVYSDSELLVRQIRGEYQVKNPGLLELYRKSVQLIQRFEQFSISHVPREQNRQADKLANKALDLRASGEETY